MRFKEYLTEILNAARPDFSDYRIGTNDKYVYDFQHKGRDFSVVFERDDPESTDGPQTIWGVGYTYRKAPGQSSYAMQHFNDASEFGILSIVFSYVLMFAEKMNPDELYFSADKGEGNRAKLYARIMSRLKPQFDALDYFYTLEDKKYEHQFTIRKNEFTQDTP